MEHEHLSTGKKWMRRVGYGMGDFGCNLVFSTMASYLMFFYTDVFGIEAAIVGSMLLYTRVLDAITDALMGVIVDHTHTRFGQGRPYFIIGAPFFALFTTLTFYVPDFGEMGKIIYAYVTYILLCTAYTVVNIPLNTIIPRLTSDFNERNTLVASRSIFALLGTTVVMSITAPMVEFFGAGDQERGFFITMTVYGLAAMCIFGFTFSQCKEVVPITINEKEVQKTKVIDELKGVSGQAWLFVFINCVYFCLFVIRNTSIIYYFTYNLNKSDWLAFAGVFGILSGLPILLVLPSLQKRFKLRDLMIFFALLYIVGDLICYAFSTSVVMVCVSLVITGVAMYGMFGINFSIQPDVIDHCEYANNKSVAGMIAALQGFFSKFGMGVSALVIGMILDMGGYIPNQTQTDSALFSIELCFIYIPIFMCSVIAILAFCYKLDGLRDKMTEVLETRRKQMAFSEAN